MEAHIFIIFQTYDEGFKKKFIKIYPNMTRFHKTRYVMSLGVDFYKDQGFACGGIGKLMMMFLTTKILSILHVFQ